MPPISSLAQLFGENLFKQNLAGEINPAADALTRFIESRNTESTPLPAPVEPERVGRGVGALLALTDAFRNRAKTRAPNPTPFEGGTALERLRARREEAARRTDERNLAQFSLDERSRERAEDLKLRDLDRAATQEEQIRREQVAGVREESRELRADEREAERHQRDKEEQLERERRERKLTREQTRLTFSSRLFDTRGWEDMTLDEINESVFTQARAQKLDAETDASNKALREERTLQGAQVISRLMTEAPGDIESLNAFAEKAHAELELVWGDDAVGLAKDIERFNRLVLARLERDLTKTEADRVVEQAPNTIEAFFSGLGDSRHGPLAPRRTPQEALDREAARRGDPDALKILEEALGTPLITEEQLRRMGR